MSALTYRMRERLERLHKKPDDYFGSCTNPTMNALKRRGLVGIEWLPPLPGGAYRREKWVITPAGTAAIEQEQRP